MVNFCNQALIIPCYSIRRILKGGSTKCVALSQDTWMASLPTLILKLIKCTIWLSSISCRSCNCTSCTYGRAKPLSLTMFFPNKPFWPIILALRSRGHTWFQFEKHIHGSNNCLLYPLSEDLSLLCYFAETIHICLVR